MPEQKWLDLANQIEKLIPKEPESGFGYLKTIVSSLRGGDIRSARACSWNEGDKIHNHPEARKLITEILFAGESDYPWKFSDEFERKKRRREEKEMPEFLGTIGVGYNNGHSVRCPDCKNGGQEVWIEVRARNTALIKNQIECPKCKAKWKIVVPEDPNRAMTNEDLDRIGLEGSRALRQKYFADNPATFKP